MTSGVFAVLGGLGLFFAGLRTLLRRFESFTATRMRPHLQRSFANPLLSWCWGGLGTLVTQSSNLTLISLMGLVDIGLISFKSAYFASLGAFFGTTVTLWLTVTSFHFGPILVALGAMGLIFARTDYWEEISSAILAVGVALMGLELIHEGVKEILGPFLGAQFAGPMGGGSFQDHLGFFIVGIGLGLILQSASAPLVLMLGVSSIATLSLAEGSALYLGASAGLTVTSVVLSWRSNVPARRLAWAHMTTTGLGVVGALFFFPTYLSVVEKLAGFIWKAPHLTQQLVAAQVFFTIFNSLVFGLLYEPIFKVLVALIPERQVQVLGLNQRVRRMLYQDAGLAAAECQRQLHFFYLEVKANYDQVLYRLTSSDPKESYSQRRLREQNLLSLKFTIHDLVFAIDRHRPQDHRRSLMILSLLDYLGAVSRTLLELEDHYERGLSKKFVLPSEFSEGFRRFRTRLDQLWYEILLDRRSPTPKGDQEEEIDSVGLEEIVLDSNKRLGLEYQGYNTWLMELTGFLRLLDGDLEEVLERSAELRELGKEG